MTQRDVTPSHTSPAGSWYLEKDAGDVYRFHHHHHHYSQNHHYISTAAVYIIVAVVVVTAPAGTIHMMLTMISSTNGTPYSIIFILT